MKRIAEERWELTHHWVSNYFNTLVWRDSL